MRVLLLARLMLLAGLVSLIAAYVWAHLRART